LTAMGAPMIPRPRKATLAIPILLCFLQDRRGYRRPAYMARMYTRNLVADQAAGTELPALVAGGSGEPR